MKVPLLDLKAQYSEIKNEVGQAITEVIESQHFIMGPKVKQLEDEIAGYVQAKHAIGVASGTDAILLSLMALDVGSEDEVITTPYTFFATAGCIARLGAKPVFVDIEPRNYNIDPTLIEEKITKRTKAIVPVHLYGQAAEMDSILELAKKYDVAVVEDAAQAIGTEYKGKRVGSIGDFGCFSFFPSKNLGGYGDGGIVTTNDDAYADKLRVLRVHGSRPKYYHEIVGCNSRLDAIQAAIVSVKLKYLDAWTTKRRENACWYNDAFNKLGLADRVLITPHESNDGRHIYNQYVLRAKDRDKLMQHLKDNGIGVEIYYPRPMHLQGCFKSFGYGEGDFINSEDAANETLAIPVYPELTDKQRQYIVDTILKYYKDS